MHSGVNHSASDHWINGKATIGFLYLVFSPRCFVFGMLIFSTRTLRYLNIITLRQNTTSATRLPGRPLITLSKTYFSVYDYTVAQGADLHPLLNLSAWPSGEI